MGKMGFINKNKRVKGSDQEIADLLEEGIIKGRKIQLRE